MSTFQEVIQDLRSRKERVEKGLYNCIPLPFVRFRRWVPGTEKSKYIVITANQKVKAN